MVDTRGARLLGAGVEGALWSAVSDATRETGERLLETHTMRANAAAIWKSYAANTEGSRAGFMFEAAHTHSYNINAIDAGSEFRAVMSSMVGQPHAEADVFIRSASGVTRDSIQAKLYADPLGAADALADDKYLGMQRLVQSDKLDAIDDMLGKRVVKHEGTARYEAYEDTRANLTDRIRFGGVESDPLGRDEIVAVGNAPGTWADARLRAEEWRELRGDAATGAAYGAAFGAAAGVIVEGVKQAAAVRSGEVSAARAVITSVGSGVKSGVRGGLVGGLGAGLQSAARLGAGESVAFAAVPDWLGSGAAPYAVAKSIVDVAEAAFDLACGTIDKSTFAARGAESLTTNAIVYAFSAAGQAVIPVPMLGAVAGGLAGQLVATLLIKGLRMGIAALREAGEAEARVATLEAEVLVALEVESALQKALRDLADEFGVAMRTFVLPLLAAVEASLLEEDACVAVTRLAELTVAFGGKPAFDSIEQFDALMEGDEPLVLRPSGEPARRVGRLS